MLYAFKRIAVFWKFVLCYFKNTHCLMKPLFINRAIKSFFRNCIVLRTLEHIHHQPIVKTVIQHIIINCAIIIDWCYPSFNGN